jgi:hypothetical protein
MGDRGRPDRNIAHIGPHVIFLSDIFHENNLRAISFYVNIEGTRPAAATEGDKRAKDNE